MADAAAATAHANRLIRDLSSELGLTDADLVALWSGPAACCTKPEWKIQFLSFCKAHDVHPLRGEVHPQVRTEKVKEGGTEVRVQKLAMVISYHQFLARAHKAGFQVQAAAVCAEDEWGGFDAVRGQPVKHVLAKDGKRGQVIGAWARAVDVKGRGIPPIGQYWPAGELKPFGAGPQWNSMDTHMHAKVAMERVSRLVAPEVFVGLYGEEELGVGRQAAIPAITSEPSEDGSAVPEVVYPEVVETKVVDVPLYCKPPSKQYLEDAPDDYRQVIGEAADQLRDLYRQAKDKLAFERRASELTEKMELPTGPFDQQDHVPFLTYVNELAKA